MKIMVTKESDSKDGYHVRTGKYDVFLVCLVSFKHHCVELRNMWYVS